MVKVICGLAWYPNGKGSFSTLVFFSIQVNKTSVFCVGLCHTYMYASGVSIAVVNITREVVMP